MIFIQNNKKGFSLIEVLIASVVASIIILGIYKIFSDFLFVRKYFFNRKDRIEILSKIVSLMQADIRAKIGKFYFKRDGIGNIYLSFNTTHSLLFNNAVPVKVTYLFKRDYYNKHTLYRIEEEENTGIKIKIPLTDMIENIKFGFFRQNRSDVIKITLKMWDKTYTFAQRSMILEE